MKIDDHVLKFPNSLPNDEQQFITYYPYKFPKVIEFFEQKAAELYDKPELYAQFVRSEFGELENAIKKIVDEFNNGNKDDLAFLVSIDQKLSKVFCFKFWVINYVFADGLIHEFYVDQLKHFARKIVDVVDDIEEYEQEVIKIERDLLQTDYADIYLVQALHGIQVMKFLQEDEFSKDIISRIVPIIDQHDESNMDKIAELWKPIVERMADTSDSHYSDMRDVRDDDSLISVALLDLPPLRLPFVQTKMRKTLFPLYSFLNHTVEFRKQNEALGRRYENMKSTIDEIFTIAKVKLPKEEFSDMKLSYDMAKCFSMSKDIMGNVDHVLLPLWYGEVHKRVLAILSKVHEVRCPGFTHASMFASFMWYLPDELKAKVLSVDNTFWSPDNT